jgi:pimeloyl-ACP methyl ester carboxylesterase
MRPETRYTKSPEGGYVAYQLFGSGSVPLVFVTNWITNCDAMWEEPTMAAYFDRMGKFARVLCFDKRGTGVSDPVPAQQPCPGSRNGWTTSRPSWTPPKWDALPWSGTRRAAQWP